MKQLGIFCSPAAPDTSSLSVASRAYWKLYVDGAARNNPGPAGAGIYLMKNEHVVEASGYALGIKTNNQAEYLALLIGLVYVRQHMDVRDLVLIISDSQLLIRQLQGVYKVRHAALKPLYGAALRLLHDINYDCMHVLREDNEQADALANHGIDKKVAVPASITSELGRYGVLL